MKPKEQGIPKVVVIVFGLQFLFLAMSDIIAAWLRPAYDLSMHIFIDFLALVGLIFVWKFRTK